MPIELTRTEQGEVRGVPREGCTVFYGVPYAAPPVGALRFSPPEPPAAYQDVFEANGGPVACCQTRWKAGDFYYKEFYGDKATEPVLAEDCLKLDIWTPAQSAGAKLPVAVWIHGGAFASGFNREIEFSGEEYCKRGIVFVSINYRVGPLGFLAHKELSARSKSGTSGNYGILDQIAALQWIKANIAAFGGDPECVTLFGQSAGAMSVQALCSSPLARGLFSRAILQSGGGYRLDMARCVPREEAEAAGAEFVKFLGASSLDAVMEMDALELSLRGHDFFGNRGRILPFCPKIDGWVLPSSFDEIIDKGDIAAVPYMIGSNDNDFGAKGDDPRPLHDAALQFAKKLKNKPASPVYVYYFKRQLPGDDAGAFHSAELWYMFGTLGRCWRPMTEADRDLSRRMLDCWAAFIKGGLAATAETAWLPYADGGYVQEWDVRA